MQNLDLKNKTVFITGVAGFIGSNLAERLLKEIEGIKIVGLDNMNDYYDVRLKEYRLEKLSSSKMFSFIKGNLADKEVVNSIFEKYKPQVVVNLGAQAGVRYSITNPDAYIEGNLIGFYNILEGCRHYPVEHLVYASSSSVYGSNKKVPYSTEDKVDNPVSLYAKEAYSDADFVVIAAPTNYDSKKNFFDTSAVEAVIKLVIEYIEPYFESAMCLVAPLVLGAGIKVKILESLSSGIPVLTNDIGIEGIQAVHEREYFHCTEPSEYEKYIRALYNKEIDEEKLEENSRQFMKKNFDIKKSLNDYKEMLLLSED